MATKNAPKKAPPKGGAPKAPASAGAQKGAQSPPPKAAGQKETDEPRSAERGLNRVDLIGRLGMDPEINYTQSGIAVMRISLATNEVWVKDEERHESVEWHRVIVWGNRGDALAKILKKGDRLYVTGRVQTREWEDPEGNRRWATEIVARDVILLGGKKAARRPDDDAPGYGDDDIPF